MPEEALDAFGNNGDVFRLLCALRMQRQAQPPQHRQHRDRRHALGRLWYPIAWTRQRSGDGRRQRR
eukprot:2708274-Rhodomonas_salina.1